jgi:putative transposase
MFSCAHDYAVFEAVLEETASLHRVDVELFAYCIMPNHWHLVLSPANTDALSAFMHRLTTTHARRWHHEVGTTGQGAVYQGRYTAIPVQNDRHFLTVCRYVERNALRASLVRHAEDWPWSSLWRRQFEPGTAWLAPWPVERMPSWKEEVNTPQTPGELAALREAIRRGLPFGDAVWQDGVEINDTRGVGAPRRRPRRHTRPQNGEITNT